MKFPLYTNRRLRPEVPPILALKNSMQNGSIAPSPNFIRGRYDRHGCRS